MSCGTEIIHAGKKIYSGKVVAGFELQDMLGLGGMGEVWLAYQKSMDRRVALKILSPFLANDESFVDNFLQEVKLSAKLDHPDIVSAFDAGCEDGIYYLAMTYVPGETFSARILREKQLPENEILNAAFHVGKALQYAWDKLHILHRDVNPSNIMLTPDGDIKLMDMGISKSMAEDDGTPEEHLVGTPNYISPEQIQGKETLDVRSDMYSLGATLYHLATGLVPFEGEDTYEVLERQVSEKLPPVREINSSISHPCSVLIEKMMEKDRDNRPASWGDLLADIQRVIKGEYLQTAGDAQAHINSVPLDSDRKLMKVSSEHLREVHDGQIERLVRGGRRPMLLPLLILLVMAGLSAFLAIQLMEKKQQEQEDMNTPIATVAVKTEEPKTEIEKPPISTGDTNAVTSEVLMQSYKDSWEYAIKFAQENPDKNRQAIRYFMDIKKFAKGTKYSLMADSEILKIRRRENAASEKVMQSLHDKAAPYIENDDYFAAAEVYASFTGELAEQTAAQRARFKQKYIMEAEQLAEKKEQEQLSNQQALDTFLNDISGKLCEGDLIEVLNRCQIFEEQAGSEYAKETVNTIKKHINELVNVDKIILESFSEDAGKTVLLTISGKRGSVRIQKVRSKTIYAEVKKGVGFAQFTFTLRQLTIDERYERLDGRIDPVSRVLYAGIYYFRRGNFDRAAKIFEKSGVFAAPLAEYMKTNLTDREESKVRSDFMKLIGMAGVGVSSSGVNWNTVNQQSIRHRISAANASSLRNRVSALMESADDSEFVKANKDGLNLFCEILTAIAAGETGNTATPDTNRPNAIDEHRFYKPIKAARRVQGRRLICDPLGQARGVIPELIGEKITHNMVLVLKKGDYRNRTIVINKTNGIIIESNPDVLRCSITLNKSDNVVVKGVSIQNITFKESNFVMVDSECVNVTAENSSGIIHNSRLLNVVCRGSLKIDHCLLGSVAAAGNGELYIRNSIIYGKNLITRGGEHLSFPCFRISEEIPPSINLRNCIVFTIGAIGANYPDWALSRLASPQELSAQFSVMSEMKQFINVTNCLTTDPQFVNADEHDYRLKINSPAKKAGMTGRDLGSTPNLKPIAL